MNLGAPSESLNERLDDQPIPELRTPLMETVVREIAEIAEAYKRRFCAMPAGDFSAKPLSNKWSRKEVVGHLIDSAQNNLRRFITAQYEPIPPLIVYQQDFWVQSNQYQELEQQDIVELWRLLNLQICAVLKSMPEENYDNACNTGSLRTLHWLAADYVKHMKHHINQIIPGSFDVVYGA